MSTKLDRSYPSYLLPPSVPNYRKFIDNVVGTHWSYFWPTKYKFHLTLTQYMPYIHCATPLLPSDFKLILFSSDFRRLINYINSLKFTECFVRICRKLHPFKIELFTQIIRKIINHKEILFEYQWPVPYE